MKYFSIRFDNIEEREKLISLAASRNFEIWSDPKLICKTTGYIFSKNNATYWSANKRPDSISYEEGVKLLKPPIIHPTPFGITFNNHKERDQIIAAALKAGYQKSETNVFVNAPTGEHTMGAIIKRRADEDYILYATPDEWFQDHYETALPFAEGMQYFFNIDVTPTRNRLLKETLCASYRDEIEFEALITAAEARGYQSHIFTDSLSEYIKNRKSLIFWTNGAYTLNFSGKEQTSFEIAIKQLQLPGSNEPEPIVSDDTIILERLDDEFDENKIYTTPTLIKETNMTTKKEWDIGIERCIEVKPMDLTFERRVAKNIAKILWWPTKRVGAIGIKTGRKAFEFSVAAAMIYGVVRFGQSEVGQNLITWVVNTAQTVTS